MSFVPESLETRAGWMAKHIQDTFRENFLTGNKYSLKFSQCRFSFFLTKGNIFFSESRSNDYSLQENWKTEKHTKGITTQREPVLNFGYICHQFLILKHNYMHEKLYLYNRRHKQDYLLPLALG